MDSEGIVFWLIATALVVIFLIGLVRGVFGGKRK